MPPKFRAAVARIVSWILTSWTVHTAATPNISTFTVPQDGFIVGGWAMSDVKTAITVLALMVEKNGSNILTGSGVDLNAAAVRTPVALAFLAAAVDANGWVPVSAGDVITVDIDTLTGTNASGITVQLDFIPK